MEHFCLTVAVKLVVTVLIDLYFQTIWPTWLFFLVIWKTFQSITGKWLKKMQVYSVLLRIGLSQDELSYAKVCLLAAVPQPSCRNIAWSTAFAFVSKLYTWDSYKWCSTWTFQIFFMSWVSHWTVLIGMSQIILHVKPWEAFSLIRQWKCLNFIKFICLTVIHQNLPYILAYRSHFFYQKVEPKN